MLVIADQMGFFMNNQRPAVLQAKCNHILGMNPFKNLQYKNV